MKFFNINKYTPKIILIILALMLSSCFELVEEVTLNNDGSGNILLTLNFSRSKSNINSIMLLDSVNGYKVLSQQEIKAHIADIKNHIANINGVSNVKTNSNFEDYIFNISCKFTNLSVLNKVITSFNKNKDVTVNKQFSYNKKTKTFTRTYNYDLQKEVQKIKTKDKEILKNASITTIYRFQSPILSVKNKLAKISKNRKAVMLRVGINDMIANKQNIKNTIKLK